MKDATKAIVMTKKGEINKHVKNALIHCRIEGDKIYTGYYNGSGKWATASSAASTVKAILKAEGFDFKQANGAPRGGITGEHLLISEDAVSFLQTIK